MLRKDDADEFKRGIRAFSFTREGTMILVIANTEDGKPHDEKWLRKITTDLEQIWHRLFVMFVCGKNETDWN